MAKMRQQEVQRALTDGDDAGPKGKRTARPQASSNCGANYPELANLPLIQCMAPGCKNTFRLPWGYYNDHINIWSGVCGATCNNALWALRVKESLKAEAAFLLRIGVEDGTQDVIELGGNLPSEEAIASEMDASSIALC
jgi:hypothetical protein